VAQRELGQGRRGKPSKAIKNQATCKNDGKLIRSPPWSPWNPPELVRAASCCVRHGAAESVGVGEGTVAAAERRRVSRDRAIRVVGLPRWRGVAILATERRVHGRHCPDRSRPPFGRTWHASSSVVPWPWDCTERTSVITGVIWLHDDKSKQGKQTNKLCRDVPVFVFLPLPT
jgi:hypothetical protein